MYDRDGAVFLIVFLQAFQHAKPVQPRHDAVDDGNVRTGIAYFVHRVNAVHGNRNDGHVFLLVEVSGYNIAKILIIIC